MRGPGASGLAPEVPADRRDSARERANAAARSDDPEYDADEADREDRPPRLLVPAGHRVPGEQGNEAEDRDGRDPAHERELRRRLRRQDPPEEAAQLKGGEREREGDQEQDATDTRDLPAEDELVGWRALVLEAEERVGPRLEQGRVDARPRRVEAVVALERAVGTDLDVFAPTVRALLRGGRPRPRVHSDDVLHDGVRTLPPPKRVSARLHAFDFDAGPLEQLEALVTPVRAPVVDLRRAAVDDQLRARDARLTRDEHDLARIVHPDLDERVLLCVN